MNIDRRYFLDFNAFMSETLREPFDAQDFFLRLQRVQNIDECELLESELSGADLDDETRARLERSVEIMYLHLVGISGFGGYSSMRAHQERLAHFRDTIQPNLTAKLNALKIELTIGKITGPEFTQQQSDILNRRFS